MESIGGLLFGNQLWFPTVWVTALLGFIAYWWYVSRDMGGLRRLFLTLWAPAALIASAVYNLLRLGYDGAEAMHLLFRWDPAAIRLLIQNPIDGFSATYAVVVGGAAAALATIALQLASLVFGGLLGMTLLRPRASRRR